MQARHRSAFPIMGTTASVHVNDEISFEEYEAVVNEVRVELLRIENMFSAYLPTSEISKINNGELHMLDASQEVINVLDACTWLEHATEGAFTIRRPESSAINPTGFVKGWAAEYSTRILLAHQLQHWYVGIGGDFSLNGGISSTQPWVIGIADPRNSKMLTGEISIMSGAIATSGTTERGRHLWNKNGVPVESPFLSVTVTGPTLAWADAFATAVFVMGERGLEWIQKYEAYEALVVR